jgi:hypothetical protein
MIVQDLINLLKAYGPDLPVVVEGYEGGLEDVEAGSVGTIKYQRDEDPAGEWGGPHRQVYRVDGFPHARAALLISRSKDEFNS